MNDKLKTLFPLTFASSSTALLTYPLDVCRSLKMSSAGYSSQFNLFEYYFSFGIKGFLSKGVLPEIFRSSLMRTSKFFFFPIVGTVLYNKPTTELEMKQKALCGALAAIPEVLLISPLDVAKLGVQIDMKNTYQNQSLLFMKNRIKTKGINSLWVGWAGMQWRQSTWTGIYFATLQFWKNAIEPSMLLLNTPNTVTSLTSGFLAGFGASFINTPGDVVRSVVQRKAFEDMSRPIYGVGLRSVAEHINVARDIIKSNGIKGLYAGFGFKALHLGSSGALMAIFVPFFSHFLDIPYTGI